MNERRKNLEDKSDQALELIFQRVLKTDAPIIGVESPPGGGKSTLLKQLGIYIALEAPVVSEYGSRSPRLIMITQSHLQAVSLVKGLLKSSQTLPLRIIGAAGADKTWPNEVMNNPNFIMLEKGKAGIDYLLNVEGDNQEPELPYILVTNASKAQDTVLRYEQLTQWFDLGFVDESFQMRYGDFLFSIEVAKRWVSVGDPGQLLPVRTEPPYELAYVDYGARPYLPMPIGLVEDNIDVQQIQLPVSWRLPQDTVDIIQPAFYPNLPFEGAGEPDKRRLILNSGSYGDSLDRALDAMAEGQSLQMVTLPAQPPSTELDIELHRQVVEIIRRLFERNARILDLDYDNKADAYSITQRDILVLASKVSQVADIQAQIQEIQHKIPITAEIVATEQLNTMSDDDLDVSRFTNEQEMLEAMIGRMASSDDSTLVDTANRLQGLESPLVIAIHPCSGLDTLSDFDLEIGRLCVMLSRHRVGCLLVSRANVHKLLAKPYLSGERALENDPAEDVHKGLVAHRCLLNELHKKGRIW